MLLSLTNLFIPVVNKSLTYSSCLYEETLWCQIKMKIPAYCGPNDVWYEPGDNGQLHWKGQGVWATLDILRYIFKFNDL